MSQHATKTIKTTEIVSEMRIEGKTNENDKNHNVNEIESKREIIACTTAMMRTT